MNYNRWNVDDLPKDDTPRMTIPEKLDSENILHLTKKQLKEITIKKFGQHSDQYLEISQKISSAFYYRLNTHHGTDYKALYEELIKLLG